MKRIIDIYFANRTWLLLVCLAALGCSPDDIGTVSGTVTADGEPLPKAMVSFFPRPDGRASHGLTDDQGAYELTYTRDKMGAEVGEHMVRISTAIESGDYGKTAPEKLPAKYNLSSELSEQVQPGHNVIDFDLDYEGRVIQSGY